MSNKGREECGITLCVASTGEGCEISLSGTCTLADFADELTATFDACQPGATVRVALLPPFTAGLSAPSAFNVIVHAWTMAAPERRCKVECLVASRAVMDVLASLLPANNESEVRFQFGSTQLCVREGDLIAVGADAIVNASNTQLRLGGGVSAAIRQACGPGLAAEMSGIARRRSLADGDAVITGSHGLKTARHIIHVASAAGDAETVARSIRNVLRLSAQHRFNIVSTPALGTGTGGLPIAHFAEILVAELSRHAEGPATQPRVFCVVLYRNSDAQIVVEVLRRLWPADQ